MTSVTSDEASMADIKGPAIPEDTFDMTGHCCGARYTGIKDLTEQGFRFELTDEARAYLRAQGMELPQAPKQRAQAAPDSPCKTTDAPADKPAGSA